jgi:hypothetical protein
MSLRLLDTAYIFLKRHSYPVMDISSYALALGDAARHGALGIMEVLVETIAAHGELKRGVESKLQYALDRACMWEGDSESRTRMLVLLVSLGADVNGFHDFITPLERVAVNGCTSSLAVLISCGALLNKGPNSVGGGDGKELDVAAQHRRLDMVDALVKLGARSVNPGRTGFDSAIKKAEASSEHAIVDLLQHHAGVKNVFLPP